jgi:hypothetical protein
VPRILAVTRERTVLVLSENARPVKVGPGPLPGGAAILAVHTDALGATVLLADGAVLFATSGGWVRLDGEAEGDGGSGLVRLRALRGFNVADGKTVKTGEAFEVPGTRARELIARGWAAPAGESPCG